eukprot:CAMPEP_0169092608 /NCGR_PEP_ID=MMETSP1015-20121227/16997_1 /TAXON_ID=342587 /ORGANISM="Karlodinium micrum, Strain CCMP2283" /LENGTH=182 /DNA_ID=CAMNT_0009153199 /DNA_START=195 /DNA_END=743 /DNA_ORIENTATION=-
MRPFFIVSLTLLMALVVGKFCILDYWGAVSLIFVILMGLLVLADDVGLNATNALFYAVMAIISGIFDVISCVNYFQHSKYKLFEKDAPALVLAAQTIFILSPVALFISAQISYAIFSDCRDQSQEFLAMHPNYDWYGGNASNSRVPPTLEQSMAQNGVGVGRPVQSQQFVPFQGPSRTLSDD